MVAQRDILKQIPGTEPESVSTKSIVTQILYGDLLVTVSLSDEQLIHSDSSEFGPAEVLETLAFAIQAYALLQIGKTRGEF